MVALRHPETLQRPPPYHPQITTQSGTYRDHHPTKPHRLHANHSTHLKVKFSRLLTSGQKTEERRAAYAPLSGMWISLPVKMTQEGLADWALRGRPGPGLHSRKSGFLIQEEVWEREEPQPHSPDGGPGGEVQGCEEKPQVHTCSSTAPARHRDTSTHQKQLPEKYPTLLYRLQYNLSPPPAAYTSPEPQKLGSADRVTHIQKQKNRPSE